MFFKSASYRNIKNINRYFFFPLLRFLFDKPKKFDVMEKINKFMEDETISFNYYYNKETNIYIRLDNYNICHGFIPKFDFFGRKLEFKFYDNNCKKYVYDLITKKKYRIDDSYELIKVVRRFRKENEILKEYLNLYMALYFDYASNDVKLLTNKNFLLYIKHKFISEWIPKSDLLLFKTYKNIKHLNQLIAIAIYLYYEDAKILNRKILAFNTRNTKNKFHKNDKNEFKKMPLDVLSYSILRQKLRTKLIIVALCSFLRLKKLLRSKNKMATIIQLTKKKLRKIKRKTYSRAPILKKNPQRRGVCTKVYKMPPKKPCSARRSVAWVLFIRGAEKKGALCHIPGETHNLRMYSRVLVRGGRVKDLPGVRCRIVRTSHASVSDLQGLFKRTNSRSRYGARNTSITHNIRLYRYVEDNTEFWDLLNQTTEAMYITKRFQSRNFKR